MSLEERQYFQERIKQYQTIANPIVYIDESGFAHDMPRTHGYAPRGQRCYGVHNWGSKGKTNVIGALYNKQLLTVSLFETNIKTDTFNAWITQDLLPKLPEKSILVMDNATFHKSPDMQNAIRQAGHTLEYLPPYSPDLNPIEHTWHQAKHNRRKHNCSIHNLFIKYIS